jgi:hypothetical protein
MDKLSPNNPYDGNKGRSLSKEIIDQADAMVIKAFAILGLIDNGNLVCPNCQTSKNKKVEHKISAKGVNYWSCHKCGSYGSATKLLRVNGIKLPKAVAMLLDENTTIISNTKISDISVNRFKSTVDIEVYKFLLNMGSVKLSQDYYSTWHIMPDYVLESKSVGIEDFALMRSTLLKRFGKDRIIASGLLTIDRNGNDYWLINKDYNIIEPHHDVLGNVVAMQFRPSGSQLLKVQAHKRFKSKWSGIKDAVSGELLDPSEAYLKAKERGEVVGDEVAYVPPFMSIKGASNDSLVGCGLFRIAQLDKPTDIYVVEGFKDLLAARTLGVEAYAIPGIGAMPNPAICDFFKEKGHNLIVMLDGDEAGALGRETLAKHFEKNNVKYKVKNNVRSGMDVTDILVEENAHAGCKCKTCYLWRESKIFDPDNCVCRVCKKSHQK